MGERRNRSLAVDLIGGVLAGGAATWLMGRATTWLYQREGREVRQREEAVRGHRTAYGAAAEDLVGAAGVELTDRDRRRAGRGIHWALGLGGGLGYALLRRRFPAIAWGWGLGFGTAFWLLFDEAAVSLLGLTPPPQEFPWQTHARGLAGHLVYGVAAELALDAVDAVA